MMFPWLGRRNFRPNGVPVGEFGNKFRKAREKKELSFDDVSNVTKISSRMLQAIEEEHFDQLPGGVFNKGFIRAYAKHLGLNDEEAVNDYLACLRQAQIDAHEVWQPERPAPPRPVAPEKPRVVGPSKPGLSRPVLNRPAVRSQSPAPTDELPELQLPRAEDVRPRRKDFAEPRAIPWRILAITAVLVILGVILWTRRSHSTNTAAASSSPARTAQSTPPAPAPILASAQASKNQPSATRPANAASAHPSTPNSQAPQHSAAVANLPATAASPTTPPAVDASESVNEKNDVTVRSFAKSIPQPSEASAAPLLRWSSAPRKLPGSRWSPTVKSSARKPSSLPPTPRSAPPAKSSPKSATLPASRFYGTARKSLPMAPKPRSKPSSSTPPACESSPRHRPPRNSPFHNKSNPHRDLTHPPLTLPLLPSTSTFPLLNSSPAI